MKKNEVEYKNVKQDFAVFSSLTYQAISAKDDVEKTNKYYFYTDKKLMHENLREKCLSASDGETSFFVALIRKITFFGLLGTFGEN